MSQELCITADSLGLVADSPVLNTGRCFSLSSMPSFTYDASTSSPQGLCLGLRGRQVKGKGTCSIGCSFPFNAAQGSPHLDDPQVGAQLTVQPGIIPADTAVHSAVDEQL